MPYKRKTQKSKGKGKRKRSNATTASKALSLAKKTYYMCKPENKFNDIVATAWTPDFNGIVIPLDTIPVGDAYNQRDGREVMLKTLQIKGRIYLSGATRSEELSMYLIESTTDTPVLLASNVFNLNNDTSILERKIDSAKLYKVHKRWTYTLSINGKDSFPVNMYRTLNHKVIYDKDNTTGVNPTRGAMNLVLVSSAAAAATVTALDANIRVKFTDA